MEKYFVWIYPNKGRLFALAFKIFYDKVNIQEYTSKNIGLEEGFHELS